MSNLTRRNFLKVSANSVAALSVLGFASQSFAKEENQINVVIAGGGYGGSTAAKYLKLLNPAINVTLIDRNVNHVSCAMSNEVIFGLRKIKEITKSLPNLAKKYGFNFVQANVTSLDKENKILKTSNGEFKYDKLLVSPGIDMDIDPNLNFSEEDIEKNIPHSWIAGKQTETLMKLIKKVKKGDTMVLRTPKVPYRCPPGPYERACLFGEYAKKKGAKLIVLDPNPTIMSKKPLFEKAFNELYKDVLEYVPNSVVTEITKDKVIKLEGGREIKADLINYVHNNKAAKMAFDLGLVKEGEKWCAINPASFESLLAKDVYILGDAIDPKATDSPKSGTVANAIAKVVVENLIKEFNGKEPRVPIYGNTCYSLVSSNESIWIATIYEYNAKANKILVRNGANGIPKESSVENKLNGHGWAQNILNDTFN